jgi:hypothetical protein
MADARPTVAVEARPAGAPMTISTTCPICRRLLSTAPVTLWDGRSYCLSCVEAGCAGLAEYAAEHPVLELIPRRVGFWKTLTILLVVVSIGLGFWFGIPVFWFALTEPQGDMGKALVATALLVGLASVLVLIMAVVAFIAELFSPCRIAVAAGRVEIDTPWLAIDEELADFSWCVIPATRLDWFKRAVRPRGSGQLLVFPKEPGDWKEPWRLELGLDADAFRRWHAFLHLAAGPDLAPAPTALSRRSEISIWLFTLFFFPIGFIVAMTLVPWMRDLLVALGVERPAAACFAFSLFLPGFALLFLWETFRRGLARQRETGIPSPMLPRQRLHDVKGTVGAVLGIIAAIVFVRVVDWLSYGFLVALWFTMGWVCGRSVTRMWSPMSR